jgi:anti-sigma factor RsiW
MNCDEFRSLVDAYLDGELEIPAAIQLDQHARDCSACHRLLSNRVALAASFRSPELRYVPPRGSLRAVTRAIRTRPRLEEKVRLPGQAAFGPGWRWATGILGLIILAALGLGMQRFLAEQHADRRSEEVVAAHVRSLLAVSPVDVVSNDRHVVKPWFAGKLEFAPEVRDLARDGFDLVGGRLDFVGDSKVCALIYRHRRHLISLFLRPSERDGAPDHLAPRSRTRLGYRTLGWEHDGMSYWAVSDLNEADLRRFVELQRR